MRAESGCAEVPLRVSIVCVSLRGGGTERIVTRLANHVSQEHFVSVVTLSASGSFYHLDERIELREPPAYWQRISRPLRLARQLGHLYRSLRNSRPSCCLIFGEDIATAGCLVARAAGIRRVLVFTRGTPRRSLSGLKGFLNILSSKSAAKVIVQTEAGRSALSRRYPEGKLEVIPNPVEIPQNCSLPSKRDQMIVNIGSIGRLKNQEGLIRIFSRLSSRGNWKLVFVGDGPDRERLEGLVKERGLDSSIRFVGAQQDVSGWLEKASIFAFTSLSEGFPNALAEALAAGCACISYDCPTGPSELIEDDVNGLLVTTGDETEYEAKLKRLMSDISVQDRLGESAREEIQRFSEGRILPLFENLIVDDGRNSSSAEHTRCDS